VTPPTDLKIDSDNELDNPFANKALDFDADDKGAKNGGYNHKSVRIFNVNAHGDAESLKGFIISFEGAGEKFVSDVLYAGKNNRMPSHSKFLKDTQMCQHVFPLYTNKEGTERFDNIKGYQIKGFIIIAPKGKAPTKENIKKYFNNVFLKSITTNLNSFFENCEPDLEEQEGEWYFEIPTFSHKLDYKGILSLIHLHLVKFYDTKANLILKIPGIIYSLWDKGDIPSKAVRQFQLTEKDLDILDHGMLKTKKKKT
jgi:hypothetical protein